MNWPNEAFRFRLWFRKERVKVFFSILLSSCTSRQWMLSIQEKEEPGR
jgi:hypothetical protein